MFKQLRNKLLIMNMVIITILLIIAFSAIYLSTYNDIQQTIQMDLSRLSDMKGRPGDDFKLDDRPEGSLDQPLGDTVITDISSESVSTTLANAADSADFNGFPSEDDFFDDTKQQMSERNVSFTLITDTQYNLLSSSSLFDMDDAFYASAVDVIALAQDMGGQFELDGNEWAYKITAYGGGYRIVGLDVTTQQAVLTRLIYTFLIVAAASLLFIFLISRFLTNKSIEPIIEAFEKQKQFVADASHELKTPLAVINTNVDVLLSNPDETIVSQSKWLRYIKSESERMSKLTNDLLYLTQVDYSEASMIFTDFNLSDTVENILLTMEATAFEKNLDLSYRIEPDIHTRGNAEQLTQVAVILLDNAIKYTPEKGTIHLELKRTAHHIQLSVANSGEGISPEHLPKIFDRFYRTDKSRARQSGGYGLGLSIAKAIVEQHGGKIGVESIVGKSTTFTVRLSC